jgi:excinuclease ABC subunit C
VPIVGLAKRLEEVFYPNDPEPYYLSRLGEPLKVVCHIRDEAHRFGITFHRKKRSLNFLNSEISEIKGVGQKSANELFKRFKSVKAISTASKEELSKVVGTRRAEAIIAHFGKSSAQ